MKRLEPCAIWEFMANPSLRIPEVVVYTEDDFKGEDFRTNCDVDYVGKSFNDKIKSIVVVSGIWEFYKHAGFIRERAAGEHGFRFMLRPGYYPNLIGVCSNLNVSGISSYRCINPTNI